MARRYEREGECSLCHGPYVNWGHNPQPLRAKFEDRCCDACNDTRVIPARIGLIMLYSFGGKNVAGE